MSVSIDNVFVKQFEADVHLAYQQMGTKLRSTVRSKSGVVGASTTFQKVGRGTASTKSRHGIVPVMNLNHEPVECMLADYYAGDWVDALDELKVNIDERRVVASAGAYALGRKTDELIVSAMSNATANVGDYSTGLTKDLILSAVEVLNTNDVPDDGRRFAVVGVRQWNELLSMDEFVSADYVGDALPLLNGASHANGWALHGFCIMVCVQILSYAMMWKFQTHPTPPRNANKCVNVCGNWISSCPQMGRLFISARHTRTIQYIEPRTTINSYR